MEPIVFRPEPALPPQLRKTYTIRGRRRKATCYEVDCPNWQMGWVTRIDESTELGAWRAGYIRTACGRRFVESREGELTCFTFHPGQRCFAEHWVSLEVDPAYLVVGGDWRGNPRGESRQHRNWDDWANDFGDHIEALRKAQS